MARVRLISHEDDPRTARECHDRAVHERHQGQDTTAIVWALLALVRVQWAMVRELRLIRIELQQETPPPGPVSSLGTVVSLIPKTHGGGMDLGTITPTDPDTGADADVSVELHPADVNGNPLPIPALQWSDPGAAGSYQFTPTGARLVTNPGVIPLTTLQVGTADGKVVDTFRVERQAAGPGEVATLGTVVSVVPKA